MEHQRSMLSVSLPIRHGMQNLVLKNPIITASGTFGYGLEYMPYMDISELGGFVVKGLSLKPRKGNPLPRVAETPCGMLNSVGIQNDGVESFIKEKLPLLPWQNTAVIANLYATAADDFATLADILSHEEGVAALEINISCPNVREGGILFGQDPMLAAHVVSSVKRYAGKKPVIVKLSPNVTNIMQIAVAVEDAGADMISCINTLTGMAVDIHSRKPLLANVTGGLSGPAIKPVALRCVWQVCRSVDIPVIGIGGISTAEDVLEFILVGAHAVQIGTANFRRPDAAMCILHDLEALCERMGIKDLESYRGSLKIQ